MNIIQLQDRLKTVPDQALVNYVENPVGEVPIYLALGELQRRREMKERFQASKKGLPSVAEQLLDEVKPKPAPLGIASVAPENMAPPEQGIGTPPETPEIDPRQMAASGIAANPQSAVGGPAMMKEGGIVGYQTGGNIGDIDMSDFEYRYGKLGDALGSLRPRVYGNDQFIRFGDPKTDPLYSPFNIKKATEEDIEAGRMIDRLTGVSVAPVPKEIADKRDKLAGNTQDLNEAEKIKLAKLKEEQDKLKANRLANTNTNTNTRTRDTDFFSMLKPGTDADINMPIEGRSIANFKKERDRLKEAFGVSDEFFEDSRAEAINLGLIEAGLRVAGGESDNPLANLSAGASPVMKAFTEEQRRLRGAQRLENLAAMQAYSDEAKEIRGYQADLLDRFYQNEAAKAARKGDDHDKAHTLTMKYLSENLPGGIPRNYANRYGDATDDYRRVYKVMLDTVRSGLAITKEQAKSMELLGGTGAQQKGDKGFSDTKNP